VRVPAPARYSRSRRLGEGQEPAPDSIRGRHREVGSGGSPVQTRGAEPAPDLIRGTGTGYEVWYARDERARDREVLHLRLGRALWNALCLTPGGLQRVPQGLRGSRGFLTALQKSADIVGERQARLVRHSRAERRRNREVEPQRLLPKARTVERVSTDGARSAASLAVRGRPSRSCMGERDRLCVKRFGITITP